MLKYTILLVMTFGVILQTVRSSEIIDLDCSQDSDCSIFRAAYTNSTCVEGSCQCVQAANGNKTSCKPMSNKSSNKVGGQCPCNSDNAYCNEKTQACVCKEGFLPSRERTKCIKKSIPLGGTCEIDEQCITHDHFSHCDDVHRNCSCLAHFTNFNGTCHSLLEGQNATTMTCEHDEDCANQTASDASCHSKQCICVQGFVANAERNSCLPVVTYEGNCTESNQCIAQLGVGSVCHDGQCVCSELFFPFPDHAHDNATGTATVAKVCKRKITIGSSCSEDKDCYQFHQGPHEQMMECMNSECVCLGTHQEKNGKCHIKTSSSARIIPSILVLVALVFTSYFK